MREIEILIPYIFKLCHILLYLGKLKEAQRDLKSVIKIVPKDPDASKKLKACEKAIREEAFNKAIEVEEESKVCVL